jgi:hypothetical protein
VSYETLVWAKNATTGTTTRKAVLMALAEHADARHSCYVTVPELCVAAEASERTVRRALRDLEGAGLIVTEPTFTAAGDHGPNRYILTCDSHLGGGVNVTPPGGVNMTPASPLGGVNMTPLDTHGTCLKSTDLEITNKPTLSTSNDVNDTDTSDTELPYAADYAEAWEHYPRKERRKAGHRCYVARRRAGISAHVLLEATKHFAAAMATRDRTHIMHPSTFYGPDDNWADYLGDPVPDREPVAGVDVPWSVNDHLVRVQE